MALSSEHNYWGISGLFEVCENGDKRNEVSEKNSEVVW
jgi:hypothetical protein